MAHFLPGPDATGIALTLDGNNAWNGLQRVIQTLQWLEIDSADCVARIYGGDPVTSGIDRVPSRNTGHANGEFAGSLLRACRVPIVSEAFYAMDKHRITFTLKTGRIHARRIKPAVVAITAPIKSRAGSRAPTVSNRVQLHARTR
jgi:chemotaxis protein CheD